MRPHPLILAAGGWTAGLLLPHSLLPAQAWAACSAVLLLGVLLLSSRSPCSRSARRSLLCERLDTEVMAGVLAAAGLLCAGGVAAQVSARVTPGSLEAWLRQHPDLLREGIEVEGTTRACASIVPAHPEPGRLEIELRCRSAQVRRLRVPLSGDLLLRLQVDDLKPGLCPARGDAVIAFARFQPPGSGTRGPRIPVGWIKSPRLLRTQPAAHSSPGLRALRAVDALRADLGRRLEEAFSGQPGGLRALEFCRALLLGERGGLDAGDVEALRAAGLTHLLAVSGFNVAVLAGTLLGLARLAGLPMRLAAPACAPLLLLYLLLNRDEASVRRAVTMAVAWLLARALQRRPDLLVTLALSALVILVPDPEALGDAGFQLTFAATLGLIVLSPPAATLLRALRPGWARALVVTPVVAWLVTLPLGAVLFHRVAPGALLTNMLAGPLSAAAFVVTLALLAISVISSGAAAALAGVAHLLVEAIFAVSRVVDLAPWLSYRRPDLAPACVGLYLAALGALALRPSTRAPRLRSLAGLALALTLFWILAPLDTRRWPEGLRVTALDVGQGDAMLIESSGGERLLVDAGGSARGRFDVGERVVAPALWARGMARLTHLVLTHDDADHIGGAAAIVAAMRPGEIWIPAGWERRHPSVSLQRLRAAIQRAGCRVRVVRGGDAFCLRGVRVEILHPPRIWAVDAEGKGVAEIRASENDASLVLRAAAGGRTALLMADAGHAAEEILPEDRLRADLLKVGHHGSRGSTGPRLLACVRPRIAVISCGSANRFGHPHPAVLAALRSAGVRICRTDLEGTLQFDLRAAGTVVAPICDRVSRP